MKPLTLFLAIFSFVVACNQSNTVKEENKNISARLVPGTPADTLTDPPPMVSMEVKTDTTAIRKVDTVLLLNTSIEILNYIKNRHYEKIALFIHPQEHLRFSPYAYVDTVNDQVLAADQFLKFIQKNKKVNWNAGLDERPELLTVDEYFEKYVYDVDFLNAQLKSINQYHSKGTDLNNIKEVYPGCNVVEFFFPGFEKKYEGLDFRALRFVYKLKNKRPFLVGIIHDEWTP